MRIHHIGYVANDINAFASGFPGIQLERKVYDPIQKADLALYLCGKGPRLEFISPLSPDSFTWAFLKRNGPSIHHICYEGLSCEEVDEVIAAHRLLKVRGPMLAVLFDREVVFALNRQKSIIEFLL